MHRAAQAVAILLLVCALTAAEESDGTVAAAVVIAGFRTSNDVMEHAKIDKDIQSIECEVAKKTDAGYAAALKTYEKGGAEACSDAVPSQPGSKLGNGGMRTLASFWPGAHENTAGLGHTVKDEPYNKMYDIYKKLNNMNSRDGNGYDPHSEVLYALKGEKEYQANNSPITGSHEFRDQVIKKGIRYQITMIYAVHELEIAVAAYKDSKLGRTSVKPMLYADVWWAFYAGSMETGSGAGFSAYQNAERRAKFFGTDTASINNGGKSKVNDILIKATYEIKRLFGQTSDQTAAIDKVMKCVRAQLKVSLIQGCIEYGYKTDPSTNFDDPSPTGYHSEKTRKGELWSFCSGALPFLHEADATSAVTLFDAVKVSNLNTQMPAWSTVKSVFTAANLNKMGVKCADVGGFVDKSAEKTSATTLGSDFPRCNDGTLSNPSADSGECAGDWMSVVVIPAGSSAAAAGSSTAGGPGSSGSKTSDATQAYATLLSTMLAAALSAALLED